MPAMERRDSRGFLVVCAVAVCGLGCSKSSNPSVDSSTPADAPLADAGAGQTVDAPGGGADAGKDVAKGADAGKDAAAGPEVANLCPGLDPWGYYAAVTAGATPFPDGVELLVASGDPKVMVVTDSELYWASSRSIHRVTLADGVDKTILDRSKLSNTIDSLALDGTTLYFTEIGSLNGYRVAKMPSDGSGTPVTLGGNASPWYLAVQGDYVYYFDANVREIDRVSVNGGPVVTLARNVDPDSFLLANGQVYFEDQVTPTQDSLLSVSIQTPVSVGIDAGASVDGGALDGGAPADAATLANTVVTLVSNNRGFSAPCYADGNLYYGDGDNVMRMPAAGGPASVAIGLPAGTGLSTIETSGGALFWASGAPSPSYCSSVVRAAMDGSGQTTLVHSIQAVKRLALNATHLYILTRSNQILRVPRAGLSSGAGGAGGAGGSGGTGGTNADAGTQAFTQMRFMQAWVSGGAKRSFDLWAQRNDRSWFSVVRGLGYGEMTDFIQVPNGKGLNTHIWFVPTGDDPNSYYLSMSDDMNFKIAETDTGKHTIFSYLDGGSWSHVKVTDADPSLTPTEGWAYVAFTTYAVDKAIPVKDVGSAGACVDRAKQNYYQPTRPGTYQFSIFSGDQTNCQGSVIAATPSVQIGTGEVWQLFAMGDATAGYTLKPVKMDRN
jgi:hypothetical protein